MNLAQLMLEAIESLSANKVRSALTMLGIIIGVAAVVGMMAIGSGAQNAITTQIEGIGVNLLYVTPGGTSDHPQPLTLGDAQAIEDPSRAPNVSHVAPVIQSQVSVTIAGNTTTTRLMAVTPDFFLVQKAGVSEGQQIDQTQVDNSAAVVLLGTDVANTLFNSTVGLVGSKVRIQGQVFTVIGVLEKQGGNDFQSNDNRVIVPLSTAQQRLVTRGSPDQVDMIYVQAARADVVTSTIDDVTQILRARHIKSLGQDDFEIRSTQAFLETASAVTGTLTLFLGGVAGISLLVGGIGIMNIMLVTVSERTREIGLRKAIGARKGDIRVQFLVESSLLSLGGGIIGLALGWVIAELVGQLAASAGTQLSPQVQMNAVWLATLFSSAVGLFFGIYPAERAARLEPVEALRAE